MHLSGHRRDLNPRRGGRGQGVQMVDQRVRLTNLAGKQAVEAVIVWKCQDLGDGWELGMKLLNPHPDFWGLEI